MKYLKIILQIRKNRCKSKSQQVWRAPEMLCLYKYKELIFFLFIFQNRPREMAQGQEQEQWPCKYMVMSSDPNVPGRLVLSYVCYAYHQRQFSPAPQSKVNTTGKGTIPQLNKICECPAQNCRPWKNCNYKLNVFQEFGPWQAHVQVLHLMCKALVMVSITFKCLYAFIVTATEQGQMGSSIF